MPEIEKQLSQKNITQDPLVFLSAVSKIIDPKIKKILNNNIDKRFKELADYPIETGGKRLRASLAVLACLACKGRAEDAIYPAASIEILHNNTLLADDIIDHSSWRRGKETTWEKFGTSITQCLVFVYSAGAFEAAFMSKHPEKISQELAKATKIVIQGEILDILLEQEGRGKEDYVQKNRYQQAKIKDYLKMIGDKSAVLIQTAVEMGGICADASEKEMEVLKNYGYNLGISFQIVDDILDIYGEEKKFGKPIGQDIREKKLGSILTFYTLKEAPKQNSKKLLEILRKKKIRESDVREAIEIIKKTKAKRKSIDLANQYADKAKANLKKIPYNQWTELMNQFVDFIVEREK